MAFPYVEVFAGLLAAYLLYSAWAPIDARYPVVAALVLLGVAGAASVANATTVADTVAEFAFLLLAGGVLLLLYTNLRDARLAPDRSVGRPAPKGDPSERTDERQGPADHPLHDLEQ
jgi:hypothetical protein